MPTKPDIWTYPRRGETPDLSWIAKSPDLSTLAKKASATVVVDNTFATPINQNPLTLGADRVGVLDPVADVDVVDVLLDDVVAAEPVEVVPVAHLVLHLGHLLLALAHPDALGVPVDAHQGDVADGAVLDALDGVEVERVVVTL